MRILSSSLKDCVLRLIPMLLFTVVYMVCFFLLEQRSPDSYHIIECPWDKYIPFCEYFIIPYFLWFAYVVAGVLYLLVTDRAVYHRVCLLLTAGMTLFLIISYIYPNALMIRPGVFPRDNLFTRAVGLLYRIDTPTNVLPSMHVFNAILMWAGLKSGSGRLSRSRMVRFGSTVLMILIVLSTLFLKQHSLVDAVTGVLMAILPALLICRTHAAPVRLPA